jgi:hypothetical protein
MALRRSHYQVLGVSPLATDSEIKAAFRARARALHPDQNTTKSAADQQSSAGELMAVTEAWRVLHDPQRRFDYDMAQLASVTSPPRPVSASRPAPARASATRQAPEPAVRASTDEHAGRGIPWIGVIVVLAIIFVITAFAAAHKSSDPSSPLVGLQTGACVQLGEGHAIRAVSCSSPHDGAITSQVAYDTVCPQGSESYVASGVLGRLCVTPSA